MWRSLILLSFSAIAAAAFGIPAQSGGSLCPPVEQVAPCTCSAEGGLSMAFCKDIPSDLAIKKVFSKNPEWNLFQVNFEHCVMQYIPSSIVNKASFEWLVVRNSTVISLFDANLAKTSELNFYLLDVKLMRGIQWKFFTNSSLKIFETSNVEIKYFDKKFKEHMPETARILSFEKSKTLGITNQAFEKLVNLGTLRITHGSLKKISRDMFPRPWNVGELTLSHQKIASLPEDIFADMPYIGYVDISNNYFTAISKEMFKDVKRNLVKFIFNDNPIACNCEIKWMISPDLFYRKAFNGKCAEPSTFKGREIKGLKEDEFSYCR